MNSTNLNEAKKVNRAKKMMLWFGIISLGMSFAGLTSAYVVSKEREDWIQDLNLPTAFYYSLCVIIISSITIHFAKKMIQNEKDKLGMSLLVLTFVLGLLFVGLQFQGFSQIINNGYYFIGPTSKITYTFIFMIAFVHLLHIFAGLLSLMVVIYNHYKQKYKNQNTLGVELATTFWHFLDFLWIYLFLFFYFVR
ncbi:MAG: cytochrome c oxidase subunit 3 [Flavobacteriales bacterium]